MGRKIQTLLLYLDDNRRAYKSHGDEQGNYG